MVKATILTAFTFLLGASSIFASTITQTAIVFPTTTDIDLSTVTFQNFWSSPGFVAGDILNSVTLSATINQTILTLTVTNTAAITEDFRFSTTGNYDVGGSVVDDALALENAIDVLSANLFYSGGQRIELASGATYTAALGPPPFAIGNPVSTTSGTITAASTIPYNNTGTFTLDFDTVTSESIQGGGGNITASETSVAGATFAVVYDYTPSSDIATTTSPIPEPATMSLFGSALLCLGFVARKFNKKT